MNLQHHNTAEIPHIAQIHRNEMHLLNEAFANLSPNDPDVIAAIEDRVADILTEGEGARLAQLVD